MDQAPDDPTDTPPLTTGAAATPRQRNTALVAALALAGIFAIIAVVLGVLLASGDDSELDDLRSTAGRFGAALVTYDYHDPAAHRDAVLGYATGSFRSEYQDAFDQGLGQVITEVQATSVGYVKDVYVSAIDEERAQAIVVVDIEHDGTSGRNTLRDVYFRLTLVNVQGRWKVDQVTDLNFDAAGPAPAPTTTSTSIP